jgi:hypothetical protein
LISFEVSSLSVKNQAFGNRKGIVTMRNLFLLMTACAAFAALAALSGCGRAIGGPRIWWDDQNQARLEEYELPADPAAPADYGMESRPAMPSGEDLSEDNLRDYHTDLDREEERRKSEASLVDF